MIKVKIRGDSIPLELTLILESAVWYFLAKNPSLLNAQLIKVKIGKLKNCCGYCELLDDKAYKVVLNPAYSTREIISTLFHELTHVKQFDQGKLTHDKKGRLLWKGKRQKNYATSKHEILAHTKERILLRSFKKDIEKFD
jgi:hypothetical protein